MDNRTQVECYKFRNSEDILVYKNYLFDLELGFIKSIKLYYNYYYFGE